MPGEPSTRSKSPSSRLRSRSRRSILSVAQDSIQKKAIQYDATGDEHYDAASALIKSMRGSDPDAATYWLARMLEGGRGSAIPRSANRDRGGRRRRQRRPDGPRCRRMRPRRRPSWSDLPECRIPLVQAVTYVAMAPKSNAAIKAIDGAITDVRSRRVLPVPIHLRDAHYPGAKRLGHGEGYQYSPQRAGRLGRSGLFGRRSPATTSPSTAGSSPNCAAGSRKSVKNGPIPARLGTTNREPNSS